MFCVMLHPQIKDEVKGVLEFVSYVYEVFGFTFELKLSTVWSCNSCHSRNCYIVIFGCIIELKYADDFVCQWHQLP